MLFLIEFLVSFKYNLTQIMNTNYKIPNEKRNASFNLFPKEQWSASEEYV